MTEIQGIIFDCDGTLADTMPLHFVAWTTTLQRYGLEMNEEEFYAMGGWPTFKVTEHLMKRAGKQVDVQRLIVEKEEVFTEKLAEVQPIQPVVTVARENHGKIPLAVASGGLRDVCAAILRHIDTLHLFETVVTCEDVTRHKPEPDIFLEAARRIGIRPEFCLVYEDTDPGLAAAKAAGMRFVDVRTLHRPRRVTASR